MGPKRKSGLAVYGKGVSGQLFKVYDDRLPKVERSSELKALIKEKESERQRAEEYFEKVFFGITNTQITWRPRYVNRPNLGNDSNGIFWEFYIKFEEFCSNKKIETIQRDIRSSKLVIHEGPHRSYKPFNFYSEVLLIQEYSNLKMVLNFSNKELESIQEISLEEYEKALSQCKKGSTTCKIIKSEDPYKLSEADGLNEVIKKVVGMFFEKDIICTPKEIADFLDANNFNYARFLKLEEIRPQNFPAGVPFDPNMALYYYIQKNKDLLKPN